MLASEAFDHKTNEGPDWSQARCRDGSGATTALFFSDEIPDIRRAKTICLDCSLLETCLAGAIERREPAGVWGGELFAEGRILTHKRKRGRPPKGGPVEGIALSA